MWNRLPISPTGVCSVCKQGPEDVPGGGPFWQGPEASFGQLGPNGLVFHRVEVCHRCLFIAVNHPDSPYHGKIPAADELQARIARHEAQVADLQAALVGALEREQERIEEAKSPAAITKAAVAAAADELERRGLLGTRHAEDVAASAPTSLEPADPAPAPDPAPVPKPAQRRTRARKPAEDAA